MKIAVVGSGISGLAAAWLLSQRHDVMLFEADNRIGGHSNTVSIATPEGRVAVDTGFIVYNQDNYPNLTALFEYLNITTAPARMGFGVSLDGGRYEYAGGSLAQLVGHTANLADPNHWRMLWDIMRFFRTGAAECCKVSEDITLGEFIAAQKYSQAFKERHLLPMAAAIWSCAPRQMLNYPALSFMRFFENHGLLKYSGRSEWRTVTGGSQCYVEKLILDSRMTVLAQCPVTAIERLEHGVVLHAHGRPSEMFDHVVMATHADQALALIQNPTNEEIRCLAAFKYSRNRAVLHRDASLMPKRRNLWSAWNYVAQNGKSNHRGAVSYWMNELQPLETKTDVFVTLNSEVEPSGDKYEADFFYDHPVFNSLTATMQKKLWSLQGVKRTWFCGAHFGAGFHEDGLQTGLAVAEQLGGTMRPWMVAEPSSRIHINRGPALPGPLHLEAAE